MLSSPGSPRVEAVMHYCISAGRRVNLVSNLQNNIMAQSARYPQVRCVSGNVDISRVIQLHAAVAVQER